MDILIHDTKKLVEWISWYMSLYINERQVKFTEYSQWRRQGIEVGGGGQSRGFESMLPRENFEIWNPWHAISWIFRVVMKWILKIIKKLERTIFRNSTCVFVRPWYADKSYRTPPPLSDRIWTN